MSSMNQIQDNATEATTTGLPRSQTSPWKFWFVVGAVVVVLLVILIYVGILLLKGSDDSEELVSDKDILSYMNFAMDPCQDFYNFSCGGWHEWFSVKNAQEEMSFFLTLRKETDKQITEILKQTAHEGDPFFETQPRKFFAVCNNMERLKERGVQPFLEFVRKIGKFPLLDSSWTENDFNLEYLLTKVTVLGIPTFFKLTFYALKDIVVFYIVTDHVNVPISVDDITWTKTVLKKLGINTMSPQSTTDIKEIFQIQEELYSMNMDYKSLSDNEQLMQVSELLDSARWLDWPRFFHDITAEGLNTTNVLNAADKIQIDRIGFLIRLRDRVFNKYSKRAAANYIFKTLLNFTRDLDSTFNLISRKDPSKVTAEGRLKRCLSEVKEYFPDQISRMFYDRFYVNTDSSQMKEIFKDLKSAFEERIENSKWLVNSTKPQGLYKLYKIEEKVGTLDYLRNDEFLNDMYKTVPTDEYFESVVEFARTLFNKRVKVLRYKSDSWYNRKAWLWQDFDLAVEYPDLKEEIHLAIPPSFLNMPGINSQFTSSMKYGAMGSILGHKIMHTLLPVPWWKLDRWLENDEKTFYKKMDCFSEQFLNRTRINSEVGLYINSVDGIPDNQGLQSSFLAYQKFRKRKEEEFLEPGINLTHNQLFFVGYAQTLCHKIPRSKNIEDDTSKIVPIGQLRLMTTLINSNEFSEAFNCTKGSPMNPETKCQFF